MEIKSNLRNSPFIISSQLLDILNSKINNAEQLDGIIYSLYKKTTLLHLLISEEKIRH